MSGEFIIVSCDEQVIDKQPTGFLEIKVRDTDFNHRTFFVCKTAPSEAIAEFLALEAERGFKQMPTPPEPEIPAITDLQERVTIARGKHRAEKERMR